MGTKAVDMTGKKYGRLTVVSRVPYNGKVKWLCKCECGGEKVITAGHLTRTDNKHTRSCGCIKKERLRKEFGEASFNRVVKRYTDGAKKANREFTLTKEDVRIITSRPCFYCNKLPEQIIVNDGNHYGNYVHNGIDRVDNSLGYIISNVVSCCEQCNKMKLNYSVDEFKNKVIMIYTHWANSS